MCIVMDFSIGLFACCTLISFVWVMTSSVFDFVLSIGDRNRHLGLVRKLAIVALFGLPLCPIALFDFCLWLRGRCAS